MVKKWIDIDKVIKPTTEVDKKLWKYQDMMEQIPNFDKTEEYKPKRNKTRKKKINEN